MSVSLPDFWQLVEESGLLATPQIQHLKQEFSGVKGADQSNSKVLVEWLVAQRVLSRYQTTILSAGRSGPFFYGDYRVYDRVASGALAGMFRATHSETNHPVLLQFLTGADSDDTQRWLRIANRTLKESAYVHRHLHRCFEPVDVGNYKFLVLDDLRGQSLAQRLESEKLPVSEAAHVVRLAAMGLMFLHQNRDVHGSLQPSQVWLSPDGNVKVRRSPARAEGSVLERVDSKQANYLAPEFLDPSQKPNVQTDIYALGCVLYEALTGQPPFDGGDVANKMQRHAGEAIAPLQAQGVPDALAKTVAYMMAKNPDVRFSEMPPVIEQLTVHLDQAHRNWQPPSPAATLQAFEAKIREKHVRLKQQLAQTAARAGAAGPVVSAEKTAAPASSPQIQIATAPDSSAPVVKPSDKSSLASVSTPAAEARSKNKTRNMALGLGGVGVALVALIIGLNSLGGSDQDGDPDTDGMGNEVAQNTGSGTPSVTQTGSDGSNGPSGSGLNGGQPVESVADSNPNDASSASDSSAALKQEVKPDNGELLWKSPTSGPPLEIDYVPLASLAFISARPADLLASPRGEKVLESLGPNFESKRAEWESAAGVTLDQVEQVIIGLHENGDAFPRPSFVVRLTAPLDPEQLQEAWNDPEEAIADGEKILLGEKWAYYIPPDRDNLFVMGHSEEIQDVAQRKGAPPPTRSGMSSLFDKTDSHRHFNLVFVPHDVGATYFRDGRDLFFGDPAKLRDPLEWFLGDALKATLVSLHFEDYSYLEMRITSQLGREEATVAEELRDRLRQIPEQIEEYMAVRLNPSVHWRRVAMKFPSQIRFLHANTRVQVEDQHAVINAVMPGVAAHNLLFGSEMTLVARPGEAIVAAAPDDTPKAPQTLDELLQKTATIAFDQTSLEFAARDIETDVKDTYRKLTFPFAIKIIGEDLQLNGITRNQQIRDFNQQDQPIADILTALVMKANPVPDVKEPSQADQKLLWVIGPDPENPGDKIILITTREAAQKKGYSLPKPFQLKE